MSNTISVTVNILGKDYNISCPEEEKSDLLASASYVDEKMREIKQRGSTMGADRIAVLSALNIAHELLKLNGVESSLVQLSGQMSDIESMVDQALNN